MNPDGTIDISYARPYRLWVDRRWAGPTQVGAQSYSIRAFNAKDIGSYIFQNGSWITATPSAYSSGGASDPYNATHAQVSGRVWLPTYMALHMLYANTAEYNTDDLGIVKKWIDTYIYETTGEAKRNWMVAFNNSQESFGKVEAPATFNNWV